MEFVLLVFMVIIGMGKNVLVVTLLTIIDSLAAVFAWRMYKIQIKFQV